MDMKSLVGPITEVVKEFVSKQLLDFSARLDDMSKRLEEIPLPEKGEKGDKGDPGEVVKGDPGDKGEPGESIKGDPGKDGQDGTDGRDALDLVVNPSIDEAKRYKKGTYASHNGGLWVTRKTSDGMDGWDCIIDGIHDVMIEQADDRTFTVKVLKTGGDMVEKAFSLPVMIYRDLFKEGIVYRKGDVVTWAGHMWICKQDTDEKPAEGEVWRIAVKRGQDGKK